MFVLTVKQAEDGDGIIIRLMETAGQAVTANLTLPHLTIENACRTNLVEENECALPSAPHQITVPISPFQTATIRVRSR